MTRQRVTEKQRANLIPAKKGEVRNPRGKKAGTPNFKTVLNKYLEQTIKVERDGKVEKMTAREAMMLGLIKTTVDTKEATRDRIKATEVIMDRTDGKAIQPIAAVSGAEIHLSVSNLEKNDL